MLAAEPMIAYGYHAKPLRASLILHDEGDKEERKAYIDEYKKKLSVDVLIVNQMLLTGQSDASDWIRCSPFEETLSGAKSGRTRFAAGTDKSKQAIP